MDFFFKKKTLTRITPHTGGNERYVVKKDKDKVRVNGKRNVKNKNPTFEKRLKKKDID